MDRAEAIRNVAIAFCMTIKDVERIPDSINQYSVSAEELTAHIEKMDKAMRSMSFQPRKSYVSPYAKFDKFHHKHKKKR